MNYLVLFNDDAPKALLEEGDDLEPVEVGDTDDLEGDFAPDMVEGSGLPLQWLERVKVHNDTVGDTRRLLPGDVIVLGDGVYVYDANPPTGGFYAAPSLIARCVLASVETEETDA